MHVASSEFGGGSGRGFSLANSELAWRGRQPGIYAIPAPFSLRLVFLELNHLPNAQVKRLTLMFKYSFGTKPWGCVGRIASSAKNTATS